MRQKVGKSRQSQKRIGTAVSTATGATPRTRQGRKWCSAQCTLSAPCYKGARSRYSGVQKLIFGLIMASRKLRHYFQAHEITVVTRFPLQRILRNPEAFGRIVEWALELSSFGLKFESTSTIQSRALAEFIAEWMPTPDEEVTETPIPGKESPQEWIMYFDGASPYKVQALACFSLLPLGSTLSTSYRCIIPRRRLQTILQNMKGSLLG